MSILGDNIRKARGKKGWTQKQLAEAIGVKHNSISDWERGKNKPYADMLERIMGALDVDANTLMGHKPMPPKRTVHTIAAHFDGVDLSEDEQQSIEDYIKFVLSKRDDN